MNVKASIILIITLLIFGCSALDDSLTKTLTTSAEVSLEPIDRNKGIVKYDYGALIEANGEELASKEMKKYCNSMRYHIVTSGSRISGEKRFTRTIVFECVKSYL